MKHLRYFLWAIGRALDSAFCRHDYRPKYSYLAGGKSIHVSRCGKCGIHREEVQS